MYYVNHLLDQQNELKSIESTVIIIFSIYFGRDLKKKHSYYIKDYDFITIQTQNMQGIDFSFSSFMRIKILRLTLLQCG